eukprot:TRINITY_DN17027_c0_g1_i1.p2 TRINITY_DN17027_c0_g1~~TRINITY_DN17027_c0_g1_i1.p2  ORF type:complete len:107 (-),score=31.67 TRINITY_DN17027_c0_g1_i1:313-633(-)
MSSAVGDQAQLRKRKAEAEEKQKLLDEQKAAEANDASKKDEMTEHEREYVEYFRKTYGENPRTDILGIEGCGLFCLIYIVVAGVVLCLLYFAVYARNRDLFSKPLK